PFWGLLDSRVARFPLDHMVRPISPVDDIKAFLEIRGAIANFKPDILHLHSSKAGVLGRLAAGRLAQRTVYTIHGFDSIRRTHSVFLPLERALQGSCGAIVPVSDYDRRNLESEGIRRALRLIRNGTEDWLSRPPPEGPAAEAIRRAKAFGGRVVLCIARLAPPKRFDLFCAAAEALAGDDVSFFWIGNQIPVDSKELPPTVTVLGELPGAGGYANLADLVVLFSDYEGLPLSLIEALSCGTPVVASAVGGVPEIVDGTNGLAVPNDETAILAAIRRFLPGVPGYAEARAAARRTWAGGFSVARMAESYISLYGELLGL
ncbi:MAG: glycosyltransferase, partial [Spirochaetaceae bacterium]|nr:glycosyltransferase [Spirochaetaceae bacterium]